MRQYIARRLIFGVMTAVLVSLLVFTLLRIAPGDVALAIAVQQSGGEASLVTEAQLEELRELLGLNAPLHVQYWDWMSGFLRGDWGRSLFTNRSVFEEYTKKLPVTLELVLMAETVAVSLGIPAGIAENQKQELIRLIPEQHFTQPPPRYTEASLVQALEEDGIGRPSTYAPTISTIQQRGYVERVDKRLVPTETGIQVNDLMVEYFPDIVDLKFTARMEEDLDMIAEGQAEWAEVMHEFYRPFLEDVKKAQAEMPVVKSGPEPIGRKCPEDGGELVIRYGRFGKFISCSNFPTCRYTEPWLEKIGVTCPKDGGEIVERKTRKGRTFYGCINYPNCDFTSWKRPLKQPCPKCGGLLVVSNKREAQCTNCSEMFLLEDIVPETVE